MQSIANSWQLLHTTVKHAHIGLTCWADEKPAAITKRLASRGWPSAKDPSFIESSAWKTYTTNWGSTAPDL
jgi:hypothetical protein